MSYTRGKNWVKKQKKSAAWTWEDPKMLTTEVKNGKLKLVFKWYKGGTGNTIITKTQRGYNYRGVGTMKRSFSDFVPELWGLKLPKFLKDIIEKISNRFRAKIRIGIK